MMTHVEPVKPIVKSNLTTMLKSRLWDYSAAYILANGAITVTSEGADPVAE